MTITTNGTDTQAPKTVDGRRLAYGLRGLSPGRRREVAQRLVNGHVQLGNLTCKQAATICRVSAVARHDKAITASAIVAWWAGASINDRADLVRSLGVAEVWNAIEIVVD